MDKLTYLGDNTAKFEGLDIFDCPNGIKEVTYVSDEITAVCPVTSQPDWYKAEITLLRPVSCVESKSLKLYLQSFRDHGEFCEAFTVRIAQNIHLATGGTVKVTLTQKSRGGVSIVATAEAS